MSSRERKIRLQNNKLSGNVSRETFLKSGLTKLGVDFKQIDIERTIQYLDLIAEYSRSINLVGNTEFSNLTVRHLFDSLAAYKYLTNHDFKEVVDVGSGAGFPGLALAIFIGSVKFTLVESNVKKSNFLKTVTDFIGIRNVIVVNDRAENIGRLTEYREKFDVAIARALAKTPISIELLSPLAKEDGYVVLYKSRRAMEEMAHYSNAAKMLSLQLDTAVDIEVPHLQEERILLVYRKIAPTPHRYPRRPGIPKKRPIL
ncbi:MAG: 16S rRNA (guanine(527)-N(7))-methyltransferase RsmG [Actinobacteria bacterium]|nr:16S rRNA (guanine(527)-N(7))-methyltransferase RsmG [Actinomycetota bacterium]